MSILRDGVPNKLNPLIDSTIPVIAKVENIVGNICLVLSSPKVETESASFEVYGGFNKDIFDENFSNATYDEATKASVKVNIQLPGDKDGSKVSPDRREVIDAIIKTPKEHQKNNPNVNLNITGGSNGGLSVLLTLLEILTNQNHQNLLPNLKNVVAINSVLTLTSLLYLTKPSKSWVSEYGNPKEKDNLEKASPDIILSKILADLNIINQINENLKDIKNPITIHLEIGTEDGLINPISSIPMITLLQEFCKKTNGKLNLIIRYVQSSHTRSGENLYPNKERAIKSLRIGN
jgi:hypothetical protein